VAAVVLAQTKVYQVDRAAVTVLAAVQAVQVRQVKVTRVVLVLTQRMQ
jgi:hypothetical protein